MCLVRQEQWHYTRRVLDFSNYAAVLLDLDGTLYREDHALPGAVELVRRLLREGRVYACLSNSTDSPEQVSRRLEKMGIAIDPGHIFTAAAAAAEYVLRNWGEERRPRIFNLASEGIQEMLNGKVEWAEEGDERCDAIIAGALTSKYATEDRQRAGLVMLRNGARLVGICADRVFPSPRGLEFGSGAFSVMLGYAANITPTFCGKPDQIFFNALCDRLGVEPRRCILIGDNVESDVAGAKGVGMATVLVLSGVTRREDLLDLPPEKRADWVVEGVGE